MADAGSKRGTPRGEERAALFITFEGGEGAGKSLQAEALTRRLTEERHTVVCTREPGGTPLGERLREIVLDLSSGRLPLDPLSETLLFVAARAELLAGVIAPALARGDIVVCDRFADSTLAYQGFGRGVDQATIEQLNAIACRGVQPQLTVLLDLPVAAGLARKGPAGNADRFGREDESFHERVRHGYLSLAAREPGRWLVVDAGQAPDTVTETIWRRVQAVLAQPS